MVHFFTIIYNRMYSVLRNVNNVTISESGLFISYLNLSMTIYYIKYFIVIMDKRFVRKTRLQLIGCMYMTYHVHL